MSAFTFSLVAFAGLIVLRVLFGRYLSTPLPRRVRPVVGRFAWTRGQAIRIANASLTNGEPRFQWGSLQISPLAAAGNFLAVGAMGSGKTTLLSILLRSVLETVRPGARARALLFDPKSEALTRLALLAEEGLVQVPFCTLDPFDRRGVYWDIALDVDTRTDAEVISRAVVKDDPRESHPYFTEAARVLLTSAIWALSTVKPRKWRLRDLVHLTANAERVKALLVRANPQDNVVSAFARKGANLDAMISTLRKCIDPLELVGDLWSTLPPERGLSLKRFCDEESILVMGFSPAREGTFQALNRVLFSFTEALLTSRTEIPDPSAPERRTWIFLDELKSMGHLERLSHLLTFSRELGVRCVLGWQDMPGLELAFDPKLAASILENCENIAALRTPGKKTADVLSSLFGKLVYSELRESVTQKGRSASGSDGDSISYSSDWARFEAVPPEAFQALPKTSLRRGLPGYFISPEIGPWVDNVHPSLWPALLTEDLKAKYPPVAPYTKEEIARASRPYSDEELSSFGLKRSKREEKLVKKIQEDSLQDVPCIEGRPTEPLQASEEVSGTRQTFLRALKGALEKRRKRMSE